MASPSPLSKEQRVIDILREAKRLAREYYQLTKKPLGITGEIAEFEAHQLLDNVELTPARQAGYDAIEHTADGDRYLQIKGRCVLPNSKPGQKIGAIKTVESWDALLLVLLDENFDATDMFEAPRTAVVEALGRTQSKAHKRGVLGIREFCKIATRRWPIEGESP